MDVINIPSAGSHTHFPGDEYAVQNHILQPQGNYRPMLFTGRPSEFISEHRDLPSNFDIQDGDNGEPPDHGDEYVESPGRASL